MAFIAFGFPAAVRPFRDINVNETAKKVEQLSLQGIKVLKFRWGDYCLRVEKMGCKIEVATAVVDFKCREYRP